MHNTPRKRSDGKIDLSNVYNTEISFDGAPDPRHREMAPDAESNYDRGDDSVINPFDTVDAGQILPDVVQTKAAGGKEDSSRY